MRSEDSLVIETKLSGVEIDIEGHEQLRVRQLGWLGMWSSAAVSDALGAVAPELADRELVLEDPPDTRNPKWATASVTIGGRYFAKFAMSRVTAERLDHEAEVLKLLGASPGLPVPPLVAASHDPVFFVTRLVTGGVPLSYGLVRRAIPGRISKIGSELARFYARLHHPDVLTRFTEITGAPVRVPDPGLQATTDELRERFTRVIRRDQVALVQRWCDWVDEILAIPGAPPVFVHGDLHGYNQLWSERRLELRLVADFETSGAAEPEYDLRTVPVLGPGVELLAATISHYHAYTGRQLNLDRIMAWYVPTTLGDALWRTEAGLPLLLARPGGGTPADYVDELQARMSALRVGP